MKLKDRIASRGAQDRWDQNSYPTCKMFEEHLEHIVSTMKHGGVSVMLWVKVEDYITHELPHQVVMW